MRAIVTQVTWNCGPVDETWGDLKRMMSQARLGRVSTWMGDLNIMSTYVFFLFLFSLFSLSFPFFLF